MIIFILIAIKIIASLFQLLTPKLTPFSAISVPALLVLMTDDSSAELLAFQPAFLGIIFCVYLLLWVVMPWLTISNRRSVKIVGLSFATAMNLCDIISCILTALPVFEKVVSLLFSALIIWLSLREIWARKGVQGVSSVVSSHKIR